MTARRLLLHAAVGETRAAVLDSDNRPFALFHDRWAERGKRLRWGETHEGVIRNVSYADGGVFVEVSNGQEGFLSKRDLTGEIEGARGLYRVAAEARAGKLARLAKAESETTRTPFETWIHNVPKTAALEPEQDQSALDEIEAAFDAACSAVAGLPGGGHLHITPTRALTAIDVDTAGRQERGRASLRARKVNLEAARELARQAALRAVGGLLVLDCIAPLARRDTSSIKQAFLDTFTAFSTRKASCLPPSPFGLMEAALEWRAQPVHEAYTDPTGAPTPLAELLAGLRALEREAVSDRSAMLTLNLPGAAFKAYQVDKALYDKALQERYGARLSLVQASREKTEVHRQ